MVTRERCSFVRGGCSRILPADSVSSQFCSCAASGITYPHAIHERLTTFSPFRWHAFDTFDFHPQLVHERWTREWMTFDLWLRLRWHNLQLGWTLDTPSAAIFLVGFIWRLSRREEEQNTIWWWMVALCKVKFYVSQFLTSSDPAAASTEILDFLNGENEEAATIATALIIWVSMCFLTRARVIWNERSFSMDWGWVSWCRCSRVYFQ